jgi:hypothetical protein
MEDYMSEKTLNTDVQVTTRNDNADGLTGQQYVLPNTPLINNIPDSLAPSIKSDMQQDLQKIMQFAQYDGLASKIAPFAANSPVQVKNGILELFSQNPMLQGKGCSIVSDVQHTSLLELLAQNNSLIEQIVAFPVRVIGSATATALPALLFGAITAANAAHGQPPLLAGDTV